MQVTHNGTVYECTVAVKCENDRYIKLYDANGAEIAAFNNISDFSEFSASDGYFIDPCNCSMPIALTVYSIGGRTIAPNMWTLSSESKKYYYEIENNLISKNSSTCNIVLFFEEGTKFAYTAEQEAGKILIYTDSKPQNDIVIDSIQITRA